MHFFVTPALEKSEAGPYAAHAPHTDPLQISPHPPGKTSNSCFIINPILHNNHRRQVCRYWSPAALDR